MTKIRRKRSAQPTKRKIKKGYTAGEWFMVILGLSLVVLFIGIVVTSVLEK